MPHGVWRAGDDWFADVVLQPPGSFNPLARLAVARYQPDSLDGLAVSHVVITDFVPVLPDRTLTVEVTASNVAVRLDGLRHGGVPNRVHVMVEDPFAPSSAISGTIDGGAVWTTAGQASGSLGETLVVDAPFGAGRIRVREVEGIRSHLKGIVPGTGDEIRERVVYTDVGQLG